MKYFLFLFIFLIGGPSFAQSSLSSQIDAVANAQDQDQVQAAAAQQEAAARQEQAAERQERVEEHQRARQFALERRQEDDREAAQAATSAENKRNDNFQDQERQLQIQAQEIQLQKEQTDASRENDIINHQLKAQDAQTDVTQSQADTSRVTANANATATVDTAQGTQTLLNDTGKAEVKQASRIFGN